MPKDVVVRDLVGSSVSPEDIQSSRHRHDGSADPLSHHQQLHKKIKLLHYRFKAEHISRFVLLFAPQVVSPCYSGL